MTRAEAKVIIDAMIADLRLGNEIREKYGCSTKYFEFLKSPEHIKAEQDFIGLSNQKIDE